jgi:NodT family efflux transporter outer membrane factor (OMF) lipoprotein
MTSRAKRMTLQRAAAGVIATLAGCTVGPTYQRPAAPPAVPAAYAARDGSVSDAGAADEWWKALRDPVLDELVAAALRDSPDLVAAEARVRQAGELARATGAAWLPSLTVAGDVSRDQLSRNGENLALIPFTPPQTAFTDFRVGLTMSWELDFFGHTRREVEAAVARYGSQAETRNDARVVVAADVVAAYAQERAAARRLVLADEFVRIRAEALQLVRLERAAGLVADSDVERATADAETASGAPAGFAASRSAARAQLVSLTGRSGEEIAAQLDQPAAIPVPQDATPVGQPSTLLTRRPDVRRAERDLAAATADVGTAVASQFPRLSLTGDAGLDSVRSGDLLQSASRFWNLSPQLSIPVFSGGRLRHESEAARAAREAALASYRGIVLRAFADADTAIARFAADRRNSVALAASAVALAKAIDLDRQRFDAGESSRLDLLASEEAANRAADREADAAGALALDFAALNKALGGGWQSTDP